LPHVAGGPTIPVEPSDKREEARLIRAARGGDRAAFERLAAAYLKKAYGHALRLTGDPHTAEDICQDALLKAFLALDTYDGRWAFSTWLFKIVHNTFVDHLRRRGARISEAPFPEGAEPPEATDAARKRFTEQMQAGDRRQWLLAGIERLPSELRALVVLRDLEGFSYEEIAGITGMPLGTVKSRLNRARQTLRALLSE
jgi:RNA polymerase sigma-70 factor (ECF subfamily)